MIPQPMSPTVLPVSSSGLKGRWFHGTPWNGRLSIDDVVELLAGVTEPDEHQGQGPLGDAVRRAIGRVDRPDAPLPRGLDVDAAREPVALQLADEPEVRAGVHDLAGHPRRADRHDQRVCVADELDQAAVRFGVGRWCLDVVGRTVEVADAEVGDLPQPLDLRFAHDRGADIGLAGKDDGGSSVGHRASPSKGGMGLPAGSRRPRAMSMSTWVAAMSPLEQLVERDGPTQRARLVGTHDRGHGGHSGTAVDLRRPALVDRPAEVPEGQREMRRIDPRERPVGVGRRREEPRRRLVEGEVGQLREELGAGQVAVVEVDREFLARPVRRDLHRAGPAVDPALGSAFPVRTG